MLEHAVPALAAAGMTRFVLEVLQPNAPAIRAYARAGFTVTRELDCYRRHLDGLPAGQRVHREEVRPMSAADALVLAGELDFMPSWETSVEAVRRAPGTLTVLGVASAGRPIGVVVHEPGLDWIMMLVVRRDARRRGVGSALLHRLLGDLSGSRKLVKAINVERGDAPTAALLRAHGFELYVSQFEMERRLS